MRFTQVTVYKRKDGGWKRSVFDKAAVRSVSSRKRMQGGDYKNSALCARIFCPDAAEIEPGDKLMACACKDAAPDPERALTVYAVSDNTCLHCPHFRISAG